MKKNDGETRENLLKSAKQEFLEKGFLKASLRSICRNAGVTTGALYFFFEDKEDLFASLVQEPLDKLYHVMDEHYQEELNVKALTLERVEDFMNDMETAKRVVRFLYRYYDEFRLLLFKSQGSRFERCSDRFVEFTERHYRIMADKIACHMNAARMDDYMIHWLSHMQIDIFVHMLMHEKTEEEALRQIEPIIYFVLSGWIAMFHRTA